jgi:hypothetical protein
VRRGNIVAMSALSSAISVFPYAPSFSFLSFFLLF